MDMTSVDLAFSASSAEHRPTKPGVGSSNLPGRAEKANSEVVSGECRLYDGRLDKDGYPANREHRRVLARKLGRPIARGMEAMHACDNRACISEAHLDEGTHAQNMADRDARGRTPKGSGNWKSKLTEADILSVRERLATGETRVSIAAAFGVGPRCISHIATGNNWKHVQPAVAQ